MLFERTAIARVLAAAFLALAPAAPATHAEPGVPVAPATPLAVAVQAPSVDGTATAPGSWALVSWGVRSRSLQLAPWQEITVSFSVSIGCGFIGAGVGLANPVAGIFVGAGCGSGIGA